MENCTSSQLIWPDLAPPVEAVHLRQTYNALKALLLPSETAGCLESSQSGLFRPNDHNDGRQLVPLALTIPLPLRRASSPSPRSYKSKQCIFKSKTNRFFSKESSGRFLGGGILEATAGSSSPAVRSSPWASTCSRGTKHEALRVSEEDVGSGINRSSNEKEDATPSKCSHNTLFLQRRGRSRARSSDREGILSSELYAGQGWFSANEGFPPVEIKSLVTRLQHRTYREKPASLRWDRVRSRSVDFTAVVHSNNANEGAYSECDIGLVLPTDKEVAEALRVEALERVRQRAREERVKQRRHEQELLLARQQQKQRSLMLSQQLRQKTLERIQEKCMREAEQRKDELELQVQRVEQAEAQRKYCARHRKELQQRLLQEQREMKHKIRVHAEESVRHSVDAKERVAAELEAFRRRTVKRLQKHAAAARLSVAPVDCWEHRGRQQDQGVRCATFFLSSPSHALSRRSTSSLFPQYAPRRGLLEELLVCMCGAAL